MQPTPALLRLHRASDPPRQHVKGQALGKRPGGARPVSSKPSRMLICWELTLIQGPTGQAYAYLKTAQSFKLRTHEAGSEATAPHQDGSLYTGEDLGTLI